MVRWNVIGLAAAALLATPAVATADPIAPQANTPCAAELSGVMTWPPGDRGPLVCVDAGWQTVDDPYPISDRWLSYGPAMTLHGQGRRNPTLESGDWTATPLTPESLCSATQRAAIPGTPTVGPPRVDEGVRGVPLSLEVVASLVSIEMRGDCLWQRAR